MRQRLLSCGAMLLLISPAWAGKVCQQYAEPAPPGLADCRNLHYHQTTDTVYEVYRSGQVWEGNFPILDVAKDFIENQDQSADCFTIKEVPICRELPEHPDDCFKSSGENMICREPE